MGQAATIKTILLAEDDDDLREVMAYVLERAGYQVRQARNGQEALCSLDGSEPMPSLVLLDLMMPVMSGAQFLQALAVRKVQGPPVVVVSAVADRQRPPGAAAYLRKPVMEKDLLQIVCDHAR